MVRIPNIITDNIARVCGIPELLAGDYADGLKIEHIWMEQYEKAFRGRISMPCLIVIHSNRWVRACITPDKDNIQTGFPVVDISDIIDEVLPILEQDYDFPGVLGLRDGSSLIFTYQSSGVFRSSSLHGPGLGSDPQTIHVEEALNNMVDVLRKRINEPSGKYVVGTTENINVEDIGRGLSDYTSIHNYSKQFDHSGLFENIYEDNPLEYFFRFDSQLIGDLLDLPVYEPYRGRFIFMKTKNWLQGMRDSFQSNIPTDLSHLQVDIPSLIFNVTSGSKMIFPSSSIWITLTKRYSGNVKFVEWKPDNEELPIILEPVRKWIEAIKADEQQSS